MKITQQAVAKMYDEAAEKLAVVFKRWEYGAVEVAYDTAADKGAA